MDKYTLNDLIQAANADESWEPDPEMRDMVTAYLAMMITH